MESLYNLATREAIEVDSGSLRLKHIAAQEESTTPLLSNELLNTGHVFARPVLTYCEGDLL